MTHVAMPDIRDADAHGALHTDGGARRRRVGTSGAIVAFAAVAAGVLIFVNVYGVNVIWGDQWAAVIVVGHSFTRSLTFSDLWHQINQERMFFPNLVALLLAHTTGLNQITEMDLCAILLFASVTFVVLAHRRRAPTKHLAWYIPVAVLMCSVVQYENLLNPFQISWFLILLGFAVSLFLLDRPLLTNVAFTGAVVAAVVASYSSMQGLLVWPIGAILIFHRRREFKWLGMWCAFGIVTLIGYFYRFNFHQASPHADYGFEHLSLLIEMYFTEIGDVLGVHVGPAGRPSLQLFGIAIFVSAVVIIFQYALSFDRKTGMPLGLSLIVFGLTFPLFAALGTAFFGLASASASRFTTYDLLTFVGCYLVLIDHPVQAPKRPRIRDLRWVKVVGAAPVVAMLCLQPLAGSVEGTRGAKETARTRLAEADVVANYRSLPLAWTAAIVYPLAKPSEVAAALVVAKRQRFSLFATSLDSSLARKGLVIGRWWTEGTTSPVVPNTASAGQTVRVHVRGFPPRQTVVLTECTMGHLAVTHKATSRRRAAAAACANSGTVAVTTGSTGRAQADFTVHSGRVGDGSCQVNSACLLVATDSQQPWISGVAEIRLK